MRCSRRVWTLHFRAPWPNTTQIPLSRLRHSKMAHRIIACVIFCGCAMFFFFYVVWCWQRCTDMVKLSWLIWVDSICEWNKQQKLVKTFFGNSIFWMGKRRIDWSCEMLQLWSIVQTFQIVAAHWLQTLFDAKSKNILLFNTKFDWCAPMDSFEIWLFPEWFVEFSSSIDSKTTNIIRWYSTHGFCL